MKRTSLALAAAATLMAGAAFAQPAPAPGPAGAGPQAAAHHWKRPDPAQMAERHAQKLRDLLQLRPDQEPALQALMATLQPPPGAMGKMRDDHQAMRNLTTPERLDRMQAEMAQRQAMFQRHSEAIKRFYAQLTPAQQKAFDALPMMMDHGPHGRDGHAMGGKRPMSSMDGARGHPGMAPSKPPGAW